MPLFPKLIGGLEIRERRPRYSGEPRYKRLDFVRTKSITETDTWDIIQTSQPVQVVQQYGDPWEHPQWNLLPHDQQQQILYQLGYLQQRSVPEWYWPQQEQIPVPPPPPHYGIQQHLAFQQPTERRIEHRDEPPAMVMLGKVDHDSISDDEIMYEVIEPKKIVKQHRSVRSARSTSKGRQPQYHPACSIFDSDSEDEWRGRHKYGAGSISSYGSNDELAMYSQSRSKPQARRRW